MEITAHKKLTFHKRLKLRTPTGRRGSPLQFNLTRRQTQNEVPWNDQTCTTSMEEHHGVMHATETNDEPPAECVHDHLVIKTIITAEKQL